MLWRVLQLTVFLAVSFTGIYYEWTTNGLALSVIAALCAFGVTVLLGEREACVRQEVAKEDAARRAAVAKDRAVASPALTRMA